MKGVQKERLRGGCKFGCQIICAEEIKDWLVDGVSETKRNALNETGAKRATDRPIECRTTMKGFHNVIPGRIAN